VKELKELKDSKKKKISGLATLFYNIIHNHTSSKTLALSFNFFKHNLNKLDHGVPNRNPLWSGGDFSYRFYCVFLCIKLKCMCQAGFIGGEIGVFP
jgi:hypothetical protein